MHDNDRGACESGYMVENSLIIPCLWTDCGCIADGDNVLECPDLDDNCAGTTPSPPAPTPGRCDEFCQYENLSQRFSNWTRSASDPSYCFFYKHRRDLCRTSYFQQSGLTVPCMWSGNDCLANDVGAVNCVGFTCPLQATPASHPSLAEARASSSPEAPSVVAPVLLETRSLRSRTHIRSEDEKITRMQ